MFRMSDEEYVNLTSEEMKAWMDLRYEQELRAGKMLSSIDIETLKLLARNPDSTSTLSPEFRRAAFELLSATIKFWSAVNKETFAKIQPPRYKKRIP